MRTNKHAAHMYERAKRKLMSDFPMEVTSTTRYGAEASDVASHSK